MLNIDRLIGLYNSHVKSNRICSLPFDFEHLYAYLEPQLTNSRNAHFSLMFPVFYTQKTKTNVDPFLAFLIVCLHSIEYMPKLLILSIYIDF